MTLALPTFAHDTPEIQNGEGTHDISDFWKETTDGEDCEEVDGEYQCDGIHWHMNKDNTNAMVSIGI